MLLEFHALYTIIRDKSLIYLFSKEQKEKLKKRPTATPVKPFHHTIAETTNLYYP